MRLIIEIPDTVYEAYKEWHKNNVATVEQSIIANGIPYEDRPQCSFYKQQKLRGGIVMSCPDFEEKA